MRLISTILSATLPGTVRLFSPMSMKTVPRTTSFPFSAAAPVRSSSPSKTLRYVFNVNGYSFVIPNNNLPDIPQYRTPVPGPNQILFSAVFDVSRANIGIVPGKGLKDVMERQPVGNQLCPDRELRDIVSHSRQWVFTSVTPGIFRS